MRICDKCGVNPASIHFLESLNGQESEGWLCEECAVKAGLKTESFPTVPPEAFALEFSRLKDFLFDTGALSAMFSLPTIGIIAPRIGSNEQNSTAVSAHREISGRSRCSTCGTSLEEFSNGTRNGCEDCAPVYAKITGSMKSSELNELNRRLKAALESENYEEAARLRDSIRKMGEK